MEKCCKNCFKRKTCKNYPYKYSDILFCSKYEKPELIPTHADIMTKWWDSSGNGEWLKVISYYDGGYKLSEKIVTTTSNYNTVLKSWFEDKKSAEIPPEA